jgi:single-stranded DNA-binding protein
MSSVNINRVVLTSNLTADPELRTRAQRHLGLQAQGRLQHAPQRQRQQRLGRQAQLLCRHRRV